VILSSYFRRFQCQSNIIQVVWEVKVARSDYVSTVKADELTVLFNVQ
jgi:hypothetical protein